MSVTTIHGGSRKARKQHQCSLCYRRIDPGEVYDYADNLFEGTDRYTWKECAHCRAMVPLLDLMADADYYNDESVSEYEPRSWSEARLLVGWRKKWRHNDGSLWDTPAPAVTAVPAETGWGRETPHTLTAYGTTDCAVEHVRANVDDGCCSACGAAVPAEEEK